MARRDKTISAAPLDQRVCPVCGSRQTRAIYKGRQTIRNRRIDQSECRCLDCHATWHEDFMVRAREFKISNILRGNPLANPVVLEKAVTTIIAPKPTVRAPMTASQRTVDLQNALRTLMSTLCTDTQNASLGPQERVALQDVVFDSTPIPQTEGQETPLAQTSSPEKFVSVPMTVPTPTSTPQDAVAHQTAEIALPSSPQKTAVQLPLISSMTGDGCPICGSLHIGVKPHGRVMASCTCMTCGASWSHHYVHREGHVYRTNIQSVPQKSSTKDCP